MARAIQFCGGKEWKRRPLGLLIVPVMLAALAGCSEPLQTRAATVVSDEEISTYCERQGHETETPAFRQCIADVKGSEHLRREVANASTW